MLKQRQKITRMMHIERDRQAIELRKAGASYDQIAKQLGYANRSVAYKAVERALTRTAELMAEDAKSVRELELQRLDTMLLGLWADASKGKWLAIDRVLRIQERRAAYLGLDAPKRQEISGPDGAPIQVEQDVNLTLTAEQRLERITYLVDAVRGRIAGSLPAGQPDLDASEGATDGRVA